MPLSATSYNLHRITDVVGSAALMGTGITAPFSTDGRNVCLDATLSCATLDFFHCIIDRCMAETRTEKKMANRNLKVTAMSMIFYGSVWMCNYFYEKASGTDLSMRDIGQ